MKFLARKCVQMKREQADKLCTDGAGMQACTFAQREARYARSSACQQVHTGALVCF